LELKQLVCGWLSGYGNRILPAPSRKQAVRYTILDDTHFESVGLDKEKDLFGYYVTEEEGFH